MKNPSTSSVKKPPSVIVYQGPGGQLPRRSDETMPRSSHHRSSGSRGKTSFDKELPQTPIQARAPNARAGLTDDAVPGDDPFLPCPRRQPSRVYKLPPVARPRSAHIRSRSSRSSMRCCMEHGCAVSDVGLSSRTSCECHTSHHRDNSHSPVYSSSSVPPRLSLDNDWVSGGLSPPPVNQGEGIGRAIG
jgi:hypothetical protein